MPRCQNCNTFCSLEMAEPEVQSEDWTANNFNDVTVSGDVHVGVNSGCCGDEVKYADMQFEIEVEIDHAKITPPCAACDAKTCNDELCADKRDEKATSCPASLDRDETGWKEPAFSIEVEAEEHERVETHDAKGKPIYWRKQKTFRGAVISVTVTCDHCGASAGGEETLEEQASSFEEAW